jgi:hypothetical protein
MNRRFIYLGVFVVLAVSLAVWAYLSWVRLKHWYQACYPMEQMCFEGRYVNMSTLMYDTVFWSPGSDGLQRCPVQIVVRGKPYKLTALTTNDMRQFGATPMPASDGSTTVWTRFPSADSEYELSFGVKDGALVSFSIKRHRSVSNSKEELSLMVDHTPLPLPISADSLTEALGPPTATRRHMMWP